MTALAASDFNPGGAMSTSAYRVTVLICVAAWFLAGMHSSVIHEIVHNGRTPDLLLLILFTSFLLVGCAALWALLRSRARQAVQTDSGTPAT